MSTKGKGKTKGKAPVAKAGHTLPRTRVSAEKFSGIVTAWKGKYGWIKPAEEIEHEKAKLRNGSLFASHEDIEDGSGELHPGAPCEFHIWEDDTGLGAEEIVETGPPDPSAIPQDSKGKGAKGAAAGKASGKGAGAWGAAGAYGAATGYGKAAAKGGYGKAAPSWEPYGGKGASYGKGKDAWGGNGAFGAFGKDAFGGMGKDAKGKDKGKGKSKYGGKGHLLPRTRISAEKFQGTVTAWKGKYGWIKPAEEIEHEKAGKHRGGLFVSHNDLEGGITELTEGATVEFHIWEDETGLGAEEVVQY